MLIDCDECAVRGPACADCVVTTLLGSTPDGVEVDEEERRALDVLAEGGLVPRLRLVPLHRDGATPAGWPRDGWPSDGRPSVRHSDGRPSDVRPSDGRHGDGRHGDGRPSDGRQAGVASG